MEETRVPSSNFKLGQEIVQNRFRNFLQIILSVSIEINNGIETAGKRLVKMLEKVRRGDNGNLFVEVVKSLEDSRRGAAHFAKVLGAGSIKGYGINFVEQNKNFFRVRKMIQFVEQRCDVLLRLPEFAVIASRVLQCTSLHLSISPALACFY